MNVICEFCLSCETTVEHPTSFAEASKVKLKAEQQNKWLKRSEGNGYFVGLATGLAQRELVANPQYSILFTQGFPWKFIHRYLPATRYKMDPKSFSMTLVISQLACSHHHIASRSPWLSVLSSSDSKILCFSVLGSAIAESKNISNAAQSYFSDNHLR